MKVTHRCLRVPLEARHRDLLAELEANEQGGRHQREHRRHLDHREKVALASCVREELMSTLADAEEPARTDRSNLELRTRGGGQPAVQEERSARLEGGGQSAPVEPLLGTSTLPHSFCTGCLAPSGSSWSAADGGRFGGSAARQGLDAPCAGAAMASGSLVVRAQQGRGSEGSFEEEREQLPLVPATQVAEDEGDIGATTSCSFKPYIASCTT